MASDSMRPALGDRLASAWRELGWAAAANWLLCFGLVLFLGLEGGGFDPLVHDQVGIALWWLVLATVLVGGLPRQRLSPLALAALALLAAFAVWTTLSLSWTDSVEQTFTEAARVVGYVGVLALGLGARRRGETGRLIGAVAAAIAVIALIALLSRLHPGWFGDSDQTGKLLDSSDRLSFPLNYWNALGSLTAAGLPLLLVLATEARALVVRVVAAALLPALMLTIFFTLSRAAIGAGAVALVLFLVLAANRLPKLLTLATAGAGGAVLILLAHHRHDLTNGLQTSTAHHQGSEVLLLTIVVCLLVGAAQLAYALLGRRRERPRWSVPSPRATLLASGAALLVLLVIAVAAGAPGKLSNALDEFREGGGPGEGSGRLTSASGEDRYQFWKAAVDENATAPLIGTGAGTFEFWWTQHGEGRETVHDAHSLYLQTLGELGIVGLALLLAFLVVVFTSGGLGLATAADPAERTRLAGAIAAFAVFAMTAAVDWMWQVPVVPVAALLLATGLLSWAPRGARGGEAGERGGKEATGNGDAAGGEVGGQEGPEAAARLSWGVRAPVAIAAVAAVVVIAIPLASLSFLRQSQSQARDGDLSAALDSARSAQNVESGAAGPRLQQALVLELLHDYGAAEAAARAAADREPENWRNWLVLSRIAAENGRPQASVAAYREARALNPKAAIFES